ncbi:ABC transporter ATP-binding protein [soil metagenome]
MPELALSVRGLAKTYGSVTALSTVDLEVHKGERFCVLGPSGSGKTTLLRLVAGFEPADRGSVSLAGRPVDGLPPERRNLGVVFQEYALFPHRSVADNIGFGLKVRRTAPAALRARVAEMLALVRLDGLADRRPDQLSGGQRQRVAIARALATGPDVLLLDEPMANLDRRLRETLNEELTRIQRELGVTVVLVTHDQEEALGLADRIAVMDEGRVAQVGTPVEIYRQPRTAFVARFVGDINLCPVRWTAAGTPVLVGLEQPIRPAGPEQPVCPAWATAGLNGSTVACIRPEALALRPGGPGVISSRLFGGDATTYRVELPSGPTLLVRESGADGTPRHEVGARVAVALRDVSCTLLPA